MDLHYYWQHLLEYEPAGEHNSADRFISISMATMRVSSLCFTLIAQLLPKYPCRYSIAWSTEESIWFENVMEVEIESLEIDHAATSPQHRVAMIGHKFAYNHMF